MSYLNDIPSPEARPQARNRILGATGMSRAHLARIIAEVGLFGRDSDLPTPDQAVVQSVVGPLPGVASVKAESQDCARAQAVAELALDAVLGHGQARASARDEALRAGLTSRQVSEVEKVVAKVRDIFGLHASLKSEAQLMSLPIPGCAKAA